MEMNNIAAIIPARDAFLHNTSLCKDTLPFADSNLLEYKIKQLKEVIGLDIIVTTASELIANIAAQQKVDVLYRPREIALENTPFAELVDFVCSHISHEHILWACVTSPLVGPTLYQKAIELYFRKLQDGFDSLVTVQKLQRYLFDNNGTLNFRIGELKAIENLPELYVFTNGISLAPRLKMKTWKYTSGYRAYKMVLDKREAIDICDLFDYECAKYFLNFQENNY
ncbi:acylneuraminate cytidylyltransferase family protein [Treponema socranskii subsp. buccale]|uniref:cytidylyltransferase domain-containing protein n=1 Tax=Treponema socranskii TaxID=53419 RepID=UPI0020A3C74B|nr:hypothetical protein [Treponema socranskii]UTD03232.1 acylneuraminate cytidylyltransferase family protein [Treponema socranskii subsp. buccale]